MRGHNLGSTATRLGVFPRLLEVSGAGRGGKGDEEVRRRGVRLRERKG